MNGDSRPGHIYLVFPKKKKKVTFGLDRLRRSDLAKVVKFEGKPRVSRERWRQPRATVGLASGDCRRQISSLSSASIALDARSSRWLCLD